MFKCSSLLGKWIQGMKNLQPLTFTQGYNLFIEHLKVANVSTCLTHFQQC